MDRKGHREDRRSHSARVEVTMIDKRKRTLATRKAEIQVLSPLLQGVTGRPWTVHRMDCWEVILCCNLSSAECWRVSWNRSGQEGRQYVSYAQDRASGHPGWSCTYPKSSWMREVVQEIAARTKEDWPDLDGVSVPLPLTASSFHRGVEVPPQDRAVDLVAFAFACSWRDSLQQVQLVRKARAKGKGKIFIPTPFDFVFPRQVEDWREKAGTFLRLVFPSDMMDE